MPGKDETVATYHDLFEKCYNYHDPQMVRDMGIYPYFHPIQSAPGDEVIVDGQACVMVGSNNYLGLVNDPRMKEAAAEATRKYGTGCTGSRFLNGTLDLHIELEERLMMVIGRRKSRKSAKTPPWFSRPASRPIWAPFPAWWGKTTLS